MWDLLESIFWVLCGRQASRQRGEAFAADRQLRVASWTGSAYFVIAIGFMLFRVSHMQGLGPEDDLPIVLAWTLAIAGGAVAGPGLFWLLARRRWHNWPVIAVVLPAFLSAMAATFAWQLLFSLYVK